MKTFIVLAALCGILFIGDAAASTKREPRAPRPPREKPARPKPPREAVKPERPQVVKGNPPPVRIAEKPECDEPRRPHRDNPYITVYSELDLINRGGCVYRDPRRPYIPLLPPPPPANDTLNVDGVTYDLGDAGDMADFDRWVEDLEKAERAAENAAPATPQNNDSTPKQAVQQDPALRELDQQQIDSNKKRMKELNDRIRRFRDRLNSGEVVPGGEEEQRLNEYMDDSLDEINRLQRWNAEMQGRQ